MSKESVFEKMLVQTRNIELINVYIQFKEDMSQVNAVLRKKVHEKDESLNQMNDSVSKIREMVHSMSSYVDTRRDKKLKSMFNILKFRCGLNKEWTDFTDTAPMPSNRDFMVMFDSGDQIKASSEEWPSGLIVAWKELD